MSIFKKKLGESPGLESISYFLQKVVYPDLALKGQKVQAKKEKKQEQGKCYSNSLVNRSGFVFLIVA